MKKDNKNLQNGLEESQVVWYRRYWWFAAIFVLMPFGLFIGSYLLLRDTIYKKSSEDSLYYSISLNEKYMLVAIGIALQLYNLSNLV